MDGRRTLCNTCGFPARSGKRKLGDGAYAASFGSASSKCVDYDQLSAESEPAHFTTILFNSYALHRVAETCGV
eukprot:9020659-Pyramimonas_sp.AAC.1